MLKWTLPLLCLSSSSLLADDQTITEMVQPPENNLLQTVIIFALVGAFFYLVVVRPESKRRALLAQQRSSLKLGDRVVAVGILGTVERIEEKTIVLKMIDGGRVEVVKAAITEVIPPTSSEGKSS